MSSELLPLSRKLLPTSWSWHESECYVLSVSLSSAAWWRQRTAAVRKRMLTLQVLATDMERYGVTKWPWKLPEGKCTETDDKFVSGQGEAARSTRPTFEKEPAERQAAIKGLWVQFLSPFSPKWKEHTLDLPFLSEKETGGLLVPTPASSASNHHFRSSRTTKNALGSHTHTVTVLRLNLCRAVSYSWLSWHSKDSWKSCRKKTSLRQLQMDLIPVHRNWYIGGIDKE